MGKKYSKKQKIYKMRGCNKTRRNHLGGSYLAYTGKPELTYPNPYLAYTGKGGSSCGLSKPSAIPVNTNAANPAYPNTGAISAGANTIYNNASSQIGGCGCSLPMFKGGRRSKNGGCGPM